MCGRRRRWRKRSGRSSDLRGVRSRWSWRFWRGLRYVIWHWMLWGNISSLRPCGQGRANIPSELRSNWGPDYTQAIQLSFTCWSPHRQRWTEGRLSRLLKCSGDLLRPARRIIQLLWPRSKGQLWRIAFRPEFGASRGAANRRRLLRAIGPLNSRPTSHLYPSSRSHQRLVGS